MTTTHGPEQGELCYSDPSPLRDSDRRLILGALVYAARIGERRIVGHRWHVTVDGDRGRVCHSKGWRLLRAAAEDTAYTVARATAFAFAADDEGAAS